MAGRPPKPVNAIDNKISHRTKKELDNRSKNEPVIKEAYAFRCPKKQLTVEAQAIWYQLIELHKKLERPIWTAFDVPLLARYCEHRAMFDKAQDAWLTNPELIDFNKENINVGDMNTAATQIIKLSKLLMTEEDRLCISVVGRARVGTANANAAKPNDYDPMLD